MRRIRRRFTPIWQTSQNKMPEQKQYSERSIRKANATVGDLETASERLGHASTATTKKHYIDSESTVVPIKVPLK